MNKINWYALHYDGNKLYRIAVQYSNEPDPFYYDSRSEDLEDFEDDLNRVIDQEYKRLSYADDCTDYWRVVYVDSDYHKSRFGF